MNITTVEINAQLKYRTSFCGNPYFIGLLGRCDPADDFRRSIGLCESYEPEVSLEEAGEDPSEE